MKIASGWLVGILAVAIIAVLVSRNATTATAIQALGVALTNILGAIVAPITGNASSQSGVTVPTTSPAPTPITSPATSSTNTVNH